MIVVVQGAPRCLVFHRHLDCGGVGEVDVGPAIPVIVDEHETTAHGFGNVFFLGRIFMPKMNSALIRNVLELGHGTTFAGFRLESGGRWRRDVVPGLPLSDYESLRNEQQPDKRVAARYIHRSVGGRGLAVGGRGGGKVMFLLFSFSAR